MSECGVVGAHNPTAKFDPGRTRPGPYRPFGFSTDCQAVCEDTGTEAALRPLPMANRPKARTDQLLVQPTGPDTLVYDERTHRAHCLDPRAARVWALCDGTRTARQIAEAYGEGAAGEAVVSWTLGELEMAALIHDGSGTARAALSRRTLMKQVGLAAIPVIMAITAPRARAATSCATLGQACTTTPNCCSPLTCQPGGGPGICQ